MSLPRDDQLRALSLRALASLTDDPADRIIEAIVDPARSRTSQYPALLAGIGRHDPAAALEPVRAFLTAGDEIDPAINVGQVDRAQEFFVDHGVAIITALFHAALPEAYLGRRGVQVLDLTGELLNDWTRRIRETGQFLLRVLTPDPAVGAAGSTTLHAGGSAAMTVRRVRLLHAAVRWVLQEDYTPDAADLLLGGIGPLTRWRARMIEVGEDATPSVPLNQADLLATLGTFTTVMVRALERLAIPVTKDDRKAWYHLWNVVAWHLGIGDKVSCEAVVASDAGNWPENLVLPLAPKVLDQIFDDLSAELQKPTEQGQRLAKTLVQELSLPLPTLAWGAPAFLVRYLIDDDKADKLRIEEGGYAEIALLRTGLLGWAARLVRHSSVGQFVMPQLAESVTRYALRLFIAQSRGTGGGFTIEPWLASAWGVPLGPELLEPTA